MDGEAREPVRVMRALLALAGALLLALALAYNEFALGALAPLSAKAVARVRAAQLAMALPGLALLASAFALSRRRPGRRAATLVLALLSLGLPVWVLEWTLRPFSPVPVPVTGAYVRDAELGWRLRPGYTGPDLGGGPPVRVNAAGLRGPEIRVAKRPGVTRILYLGDSVTFGWLLEERDTFPRRARRHIERLTGRDVETVNAGVGGYSPWQELVFLRREGLRLDPDLVVVSFVLNDVTEKFELERFGGRWEGTQLAMTADTWAKRLRARSALVHRARELLAWIRSGGDPKGAARRAEELRVEHLVSRPDDPRVRKAWGITLENLGRIFELCRERRVPVALLIFPFAFQFEDVERLSGPQRILLDFARERGVPALDLLPILAARLESAGATPDRYFFDADHLTPVGSEATGRVLASFLRDEDLL